MLEWCLRYSLEAKLFPQASHMKGFSPSKIKRRVLRFLHSTRLSGTDSSSTCVRALVVGQHVLLREPGFAMVARKRLFPGVNPWHITHTQRHLIQLASHRCHPPGRPPYLRCILRAEFWVNLAWQSGHWKGLRPVCVLWCSSRVLLELSDFPQSGQTCCRVLRSWTCRAAGTPEDQSIGVTLTGHEGGAPVVGDGRRPSSF